MHLKKTVLGLAAVTAISACSDLHEVKELEDFREDGVDFELCLHISKVGKQKGRSHKKRDEKTGSSNVKREKSDNRKFIVEGILIRNSKNPATNLTEGLKCYDTGYEIGYHNPNPDMEIYYD